ncbi:MAG: hypothetical protein GEU82_15700 [Luteitalea sp.]|nr:hypothetical protein [Luteitalea sp.]
MSRLADALRRSEGQDSGTDLFDEVDQATSEGLWGIDRHDAVDDDAVDAAPFVSTVRPPARERDHPAAQHLAALVDRVFLPVSGEATRCVAFAPIGREADSDGLAAIAAEMLVERTTRNVCVIDANFRRPSLHDHFGVPNASGLAEALVSEAPLAEFSVRVQRNLWIVPTGAAVERPTFTSAAARSRMTQFLAQFDYVIVDVEPIVVGSDVAGGHAAGSNVAGLLRLVRGVIVVVAADSTKRESARRATRTLVASGVTVIGAVLTNRRFPIPDALYRML